MLLLLHGIVSHSTQQSVTVQSPPHPGKKRPRPPRRPRGRLGRQPLCRRRLLPSAPVSPRSPASQPAVRGAGVHPFSRLSLNRVCLGLGFARHRCSAVELGSAGGAWLLCGLVFLVTPAMQKRRRCRGIISPSFFRPPMAIYSDVNGEVGETCPGV
jgi:hypothetical protein